MQQVVYLYRYVCVESLRPTQHCWMSCSYDIVHLCVNKCVIKGGMFASNCAHELFLKNTKPFFSCRNWEALKSQEEKVGKKCTRTHFIPVLTSWKQFVEAKMNFRMWEACSLKFHAAFSGCWLVGIWLLGTQELSVRFAWENDVFLQASEVEVGELAHSWSCLQSLAKRSLILLLVKLDIIISFRPAKTASTIENGLCFEVFQYLGEDATVKNISD